MYSVCYQQSGLKLFCHYQLDFYHNKLALDNAMGLLYLCGYLCNGFNITINMIIVIIYNL